jgi:hypothetical protein
MESASQPPVLQPVLTRHSKPDAAHQQVPEPEFVVLPQTQCRRPIRCLIVAAMLFLISALGASAPEFPFAPIGHGGPGYMANFSVYRILGGIGVGLASMFRQCI